VSDLTPLAGLTALEFLDLGTTQVSDVASLAGLAALQLIDRNGRRVTSG
jgi:internalin A